MLSGTLPPMTSGGRQSPEKICDRWRFTQGADGPPLASKRFFRLDSLRCGPAWVSLSADPGREPFDFIDDGSIVYPYRPDSAYQLYRVYWGRIVANFGHLGPFRPALRESGRRSRAVRRQHPVLADSPAGVDHAVGRPIPLAAARAGHPQKRGNSGRGSGNVEPLPQRNLDQPDTLRRRGHALRPGCPCLCHLHST